MKNIPSFKIKGPFLYFRNLCKYFLYKIKTDIPSTIVQSSIDAKVVNSYLISVFHVGDDEADDDDDVDVPLDVFVNQPS